MDLTEISALNEIKREAEERASTAMKIAITPENAKRNEILRTENNKFIKSAEKAVEQVEEAYLKPLREQLKPFVDALEPLKEANKELSNKLLEAKKKAFEDDMRREFDNIAYENENGEMPVFEEIYKPSWYSLTKTEAREALARALRAWRVKDDKLSVLISIEVTESDLEALKQYLKMKGIDADMSVLD